MHISLITALLLMDVVILVYTLNSTNHVCILQGNKEFTSTSWNVMDNVGTYNLVSAHISQIGLTKYQ